MQRTNVTNRQRQNKDVLDESKRWFSWHSMSDDQHSRALSTLVSVTPTITNIDHSGTGAARVTIDLMVLHECDDFQPLPHGTP